MRDWPETENEWALTWAVMVARDRIAELEAENERLMRDFTNTDELWEDEAHGLDNDIAKLKEERDKWEWVARGVIKEDPGEAFNDPDHWCAGCQATLDHFLATWEANHD